MPDPNEKGNEKPESMTLEQINQKIDTDPAFADRIAEGTFPEIVEKPDAAPAAQPAPGAEPAPAGAAEVAKPQPEPEEKPAATPAGESTPGAAEEEVTFTVKKSEMGKYKSPQEFLKAKTHADNHIKFLEGKLDDLQTKLARTDLTQKQFNQLQKDFQELQKKIKTAQAAAPAATPAAGAGQDEFVKEEDGTVSLLQNENQARVLNTIKTLPQQIADLNKKVETLQTENQQIQANYKTDLQKAQENLERQAQVKAEFALYGGFAKDNPEYALTKPIEEVDSEVRNFRKNIMRVASTGVTTQKEALDNFNAYFGDQTEKGDKIRQACEAAGIIPPEDHDNYIKILELRQFRNQTLRDGQPIPVDEAYLLINKNKIDKAMLTARIEGGQSVLKAINGPKDLPKQLPPSAGGSAKTGTENLTPKEKNRILSMTEAELRRQPDVKKIHDQLVEELTQ